MFDFVYDIGNYQSRVVGRFERGELMVSTARVSDGTHPFETAVAHPEYNDGTMVIVEAYDEIKSASEGHDRWVALMTGDALPDFLQDCQNGTASQYMTKEELCFQRQFEEPEGRHEQVIGQPDTRETP